MARPPGTSGAGNGRVGRSSYGIGEPTPLLVGKPYFHTGFPYQVVAPAALERRRDRSSPTRPLNYSRVRLLLSLRLSNPLPWPVVQPASPWAGVGEVTSKMTEEGTTL
jgi:hypothetical protein